VIKIQKQQNGEESLTKGKQQGIHRTVGRGSKKRHSRGKRLEKTAMCNGVGRGAERKAQKKVRRVGENGPRGWEKTNTWTT